MVSNANCHGRHDLCEGCNGPQDGAMCCTAVCPGTSCQQWLRCKSECRRMSYFKSPSDNVCAECGGMDDGCEEFAGYECCANDDCPAEKCVNHTKCKSTLRTTSITIAGHRILTPWSAIVNDAVEELGRSFKRCATLVAEGQSITEGAKHDTDKDRWDLLPIQPLQYVVKVLTFGARKYSAENWKKVDSPRERYYAALMRHLSAWRQGEVMDQESGYPHLAHAVCCGLFLLWFDINSK